ncbi:branched-chain alpha-ketoacid dehydrogenase kinase-like [Watersipora subatra]|uniref:branched-chain alpha-ketoacid dehydrogenase kinase-like n=1 Tax=Watersipora subatra TaxID=2589382 RepID=UPI00355B78BA
MNFIRACQSVNKNGAIHKLVDADQLTLLQPSVKLPFHSSASKCSSDTKIRRISSLTERSRTVASYYYNSSLDFAAAKDSVRLVPSTLLYAGKQSDDTHMLMGAQYLHKELPVRIAHRVAAFRELPFIVGCNPSIIQVHELYIRAFQKLDEFPPIETLEQEMEFCKLLRSLLDDHRDVVTLLAEGFKESKKHIPDGKLIKTFLDKTLTSRLGIRMLCEYHLALHNNQQGHVGIIAVNFQPRKLLERKADFAQKVCEHRYGKAPAVNVNGHVNASFPYIAAPLEYIVMELFKNSMRATVEAHAGASHLPSINVTIANNDVDFLLRISDRGGGIPHDDMSRVWDYHFTTAGSPGRDLPEKDTEADPFRSIMSPPNQGPAAGPMFGFGFGLPACKAYAEYLGGSLTMETLQGIGTDVFLRLKHLDGRGVSFRI